MQQYLFHSYVVWHSSTFIIYRNMYLNVPIPAAERSLLEEAVKRFPTFDKLYLMRGQLEERAGNLEASKAAYQSGLRRCMSSTPLWTSLARLEEKSKNLARARAILEQVNLSSKRGEAQSNLMFVRTTVKDKN